MKKGKFLIFIAFIVLSFSEISALTIESIRFIGANADLKINVTIRNPGANTTFNLTLEDLTNDENKRIIYSGILTIEENKTKSYIFGRYSAYDYSLNENWENFRCGIHTIQAKIIINGTTRDSEKEDVNLQADNFDLTFFPDIETGKISPTTRVRIYVKGIDGKAIENARVIIADDTKREKRTDSRGRVDFRISDLFSPPATGRYTLKILKNEPVRGKYYCNYEKEFDVKKRLNITSIVPASPKVNEKITITIDTEDHYAGIWLAIEGPEDHYYTITDRTHYFTIRTPGVYKISVSRAGDYWTDERTIFVEEYPELRIVNFSEILLGKENEFVILDANNVRIANAKVTLNGISKISDSNGAVRFEIMKPGTYEIIAEKAKYKTGRKIFTVLKKLRMIFEPENPKIYDNVKIRLVDEKGLPVDGTIIIEGKAYQTKEGYITYNFTKFVNYKIIGKAQDFADIEINLKPLKILTIIINKAENEEFSVGEILNVELKGDDLRTAHIEIKNLDTNVTFVSTLALNYSTILLTPGNYEITAIAKGFGEAKRKFIVRHLKMELNAKYDVQNNKILIIVTSDGKSLENVTISVITPKKLIGQYKTDKDGKVIFDLIYEEGNYTIIAEKIYYETKQQIVEVKRPGFEWIFIFIIIALLIIGFIFVIKRKKQKEKGVDEIYESRLG